MPLKQLSTSRTRQKATESPRVKVAVALITGYGHPAASTPREGASKEGGARLQPRDSYNECSADAALSKESKEPRNRTSLSNSWTIEPVQVIPMKQDQLVVLGMVMLFDQLMGMVHSQTQDGCTFNKGNHLSGPGIHFTS